MFQNRIISSILIFSLLLIPIIGASYSASAKTCAEAYEECMAKYWDADPWPGWGLLYCAIGYLWCIKYME